VGANEVIWREHILITEVYFTPELKPFGLNFTPFPAFPQGEGEELKHFPLGGNGKGG